MDFPKNTTEASVAWYKLADLIARHEREKALNVYRLLAHSFQDQAYALQLEADILLSLEDKQALEKYKQAAFLYRKESRWVNAICVCEHLLQVQGDDAELMSILLDIYLRAEWKDQFIVLLKQASTKLKSQKIDEDQLFKGIQQLIENGKAGHYLCGASFIITQFKEIAASFPTAFFDRIKRLL